MAQVAGGRAFDSPARERARHAYTAEVASGAQDGPGGGTKLSARVSFDG